MPLPRPPFAFPPSGAALIVFSVLYLLPGLVGHAPWKGDDAMHFGVVYSMIDGGHWLLPRLAGEAWLDQPPLYHWVAAVLAKIFGLLLPLHDAARLASGLFTGIMLVCLAESARRLNGPEVAIGATLVAIGCLGLLVHAHEVQPATAFLAASAALFHGLTLLPQSPLRGAVVAGAGLGAGFLAVGLHGLITLGPLLLLLPLVSSQLSMPQLARSLLVALAVAASLMLSWPLLLLELHPAAFAGWWSGELAKLQAVANMPLALWGYLKLLSWFAWPALPLAMWTLWKERRGLREPRILIPLLSFLVLLGMQSAFLEPRSINVLPLLPPLVLLAAPATLTLQRGAANAFDWFGMMTFTLLAALIWLGWTAMVTGMPYRIARNFARLAPGFTAQFSMPAFAAALALTLVWLWLVFGSPRARQRGTVHWAAGVTLCWGLMMALWLPWIDYGRSYRPVAASLKAALPANSGCIVGRSLSDTHRATFHYYAGVITVREGAQGAASCRLFLAQGTTQKETLPAGGGWRKIWEGHRPTDRNERFRLYIRK
ncbi:MAG: glycosyltransferase family 39 protein [Sulfuritalea sp.]|nr:glycosyltransferase family 39 protein [Sulfuritalea sp.]